MPLPSVDRLITSARATAARFPLVLASGVLAAAAGIMAVNASHADDWWRLLLASALGLPLFFATKMVAERRGWPASRSWPARLAAVTLLVAFFLAWPGWSEPVAIARLVQASVAFHLLALAFALYHTTTWFNVTPKAMPVQLGEARLPGGVIIGAHYAGWALVSGLILFLAGG